MTNPFPEPTTFKIIVKSFTGASTAIRSVKANGRLIDAKCSLEGLELELDLGPSRQAVIEIPQARASSPLLEPSLGLKYRGGVALRRYFSEVRDKYLSRIT